MKAPNIIILNTRENLIRWLDADLCDVEELDAANKCRSITLTYPYENHMVMEGEVQWYEQGNKIFIPEINGIKSGLYVINTEYQIDFWKNNTITVEAEEVLTELNYDVISFKKGTVINLTHDKLEEWFGDYYEIGESDALSATRKKVSPEGIMTRMTLLRLIEEQTERTFITEYTAEDNSIKRKLTLKNINTDEFIAPTPALDLNYNLESLEFTKSEENTYNAIAPVFNTNTITPTTVDTSTNAEVTAAFLNQAENNISRENATRIQIQELLTAYAAQTSGSTETAGDTGDDTVPDTQTSITANVSKTHDELLQEWLDYEVMTGEEIPMIIKEDENGNLVSAATWAAPFSKMKGDLYIFYEGGTSANYTTIMHYDHRAGNFKIATSNTSEQIVQSIYNNLAVSLLAKLAPQFELKIDVKDIQVLMGLDDLGYQLHQRLEVRVPNFNYYVPCRIVETKKNIHLPGENTIKVETDVKSMVKLYDSVIESSDMIISKFDNNQVIGGLLHAADDKETPLADRTVTVNIKLNKAYNESTITGNVSIQQSYGTFDIQENTYYFSEEEIQRIEKILRNGLINNKLPSEIRMRDVKGEVYSVPRKVAEAIYFTRNQIYINNEWRHGGAAEKGLGKGYFDPTIPVHYYEKGDTYAHLLTGWDHYEDAKKYYVSRFLDFWQMFKDFFERIGIENTYPIINSCEQQNGPTCVAAACSNVSAYFFNYKTEYEFTKLLGTSSVGTPVDNVLTVLPSLGYSIQVVPVTEENIKQYLDGAHVALISVDVARLGPYYYGGLYEGDAHGDHMICIYEWVQSPQAHNGDLLVHCLDSNFPFMNPMYTGMVDPDTVDDWMTANIYVNAACGYYDGSSFNSNGTVPHMIVVGVTTSQLVSVEEIESSVVNTTAFDPSLKQYVFKLDTVRDAIKEAIKSSIYSGDVVNPMNLFVGVKANSGDEYTVSMYWLRAMCYAVMFAYTGTKDKTSNLEINVGKDTDSMKYYSRFDVDTSLVGEYDWFSPCLVDNSTYGVGYTIATLLFNLGFAYSFNDFLGTDNSFNNISERVVKTAGNTMGSANIHSWVISNKKTEINKYVKKTYRDNYHYTVLFAYAKNTEIQEHAAYNMSMYPVMLYSVDGDNIEYMNIMGSGNNPTRNYATKVENAQKNPYGTTTLDNMVSWISAAEGEAPEGSKNQVLVLSWFSKEELEAQ